MSINTILLPHSYFSGTLCASTYFYASIEDQYDIEVGSLIFIKVSQKQACDSIAPVQTDEAGVLYSCVVFHEALLARHRLKKA